MACTEKCSSLGGNAFDPLQVTAEVFNRGSTNSSGKHGVSNTWQKWPKVGNKSIANRAPYNQGDVALPISLGGDSKPPTGLGLGAHGHGLGVMPDALGGPHAKTKQSVLVYRNAKGEKVIEPISFCMKCFSTWLIAGVAIFLLFFFSAGR